MCTGRALVAGVPRARRSYAENHVSGSCLARMRGRACPGRACARGALVRRAWAAGAGATTWVRGGGAWRRGWPACVGRVLIAARPTGGGGVRVGVQGTGRRGVFPLCGVGHACALGLVRRPVALSGLLPRGPSEASCSFLRGGWVSCGSIPDSAYSQGSQELSASAGAC